MNPSVFLNMAKNLTGGAKGGEVELPAPQGLFDRLVNGVNRLGRPLLLIGVVLFFMWGIMDPTGFVLVMKAFGETPEWITTAVLLVISIFGTGRIVQDFKKRQTVKTTVQKTEEVTESFGDNTEDVPVSNRKFDNLEEDDDDEDISDLPPENDVVAKWKEAQGENQ